MRRAAARQLLALRDADRAAVLRVLALPIFAPPLMPVETVARIGRVTIEVCANWGLAVICGRSLASGVFVQLLRPTCDRCRDGIPWAARADREGWNAKLRDGMR